jgi:hypothetical protein
MLSTSCVCPALSIARTREFGKPIPNEREYKQTTVSQIQGLSPSLFSSNILYPFILPSRVAY